MGVKHNGPQVVMSLKRKEEALRQVPRVLARSMGTIMRDAIREQVPPGGINDEWDGYAATGNLQKNVVASEPEKTATGYKTRVYVPRYGIKHWRVHEDGATIFPQNGRFLVFPKPPDGARYTTVAGRKTFRFTDQATGVDMIATEYVIIRPKHYWSKGVAEGYALIKQFMPNEFRSIIRNYGAKT